jgi:hypothetical protein
VCTWATADVHDPGLTGPSPGSGGGIGDPGATLTDLREGLAPGEARAVVAAMADRVPLGARGVTVIVLVRMGGCAP